MGMKGIPPLSSQGQLGVCCMFIYQVRPREYSQPCISFPHASANGIFYNLAPIKSLPWENLPWLLPSAAPRVSLTSSHAMGCLCHCTPFHPKTLHSSHLRSLHHLCICCLPLGLVCSAPSSLLGYLLPQITCEFHRENFLEASDSFRSFYYLHSFNAPFICRTHTSYIIKG